MLPYLHPLLAALVLALLAWSASLGVRSRSDRRRRAEYLELHARIGPWMYAGVVTSLVAGLAAMWWLRPADELATTAHFQAGVALVAALTASFVSSRWMHVAQVRAVHPWFGVLAMLVAAAQFVFGLQLLP